MRFTSVDLQAIFRFERVFALVTLESFLNNNLFSCFFNRNMFTLQGIRSLFKLLLQKLGSSSCIPSQSRWGFLLLLLCFRSQSSLPTGVQAEGEAVPKVQGKGEGERLAGQCLADYLNRFMKFCIPSRMDGSYFEVQSHKSTLLC